jgi:hypothetical protein
MRRDQLDAPAGFRDPVELADKSHEIRDVFDSVIRDDGVEFVIRKWIGKRSEIVDDIGGRLRIIIQSDRTRSFVYAASDVKDLHRGDSFLVSGSWFQVRSLAVSVRKQKTRNQETRN